MVTTQSRTALLRHAMIDHGCWLFNGKIRTGRNAYPRVNAGKPKTEIAHRVAYELWVGPIPEGMVIDHLCRVPTCVNPAHLEAVTHRENILRGTGFSARHARQDALQARA